MHAPAMGAPPLTLPPPPPPPLLPAAAPSPHPRLPFSLCQACSKYEYVKQYELDDRLLPGCWIVVRLDGKGFTKCARQLGAPLPLPLRRVLVCFPAAMHCEQLWKCGAKVSPTPSGSAICTSLRSPTMSAPCGSWTKRPRWVACFCCQVVVGTAVVSSPNIPPSYQLPLGSDSLK